MREILDFTKEKVQQLSLDELKQTYKENDVYGKPLRGMYHFDVIDRVQEILDRNNLNCMIQEVFAAQNADKHSPGVVVLPQVEETTCKNSVKAHVLRRVYTNIKVEGYDTDELTTNVAIAFHQRSIELAWGNMVKICHNQCILNPEHVLSTYRGIDIFTMLDKFEVAMHNFVNDIITEREMIEKMKAYIIEPQQLFQIIGELNTIRIARDSMNPNIHKVDMYPLNQTQLNKFTENLLVQKAKEEYITMWDLYNAATELYKPGLMEIPNMFGQHVALNKYIQNFIY